MPTYKESVLTITSYKTLGFGFRMGFRVGYTFGRVNTKLLEEHNNKAAAGLYVIGGALSNIMINGQKKKEAEEKSERTCRYTPDCNSGEYCSFNKCRKW